MFSFILWSNLEGEFREWRLTGSDAKKKKKKSMINRIGCKQQQQQQRVFRRPVPLKVSLVSGAKIIIAWCNHVLY